jgi:hypothetical protein
MGTREFNNVLSDALSGVIARADERLTPEQRANLEALDLLPRATRLLHRAAPPPPLSLNPAVLNVRRVIAFVHPDGSWDMGTREREPPALYRTRERGQTIEEWARREARADPVANRIAAEIRAVHARIQDLNRS